MIHLENEEENNYLELVKNILEYGENRNDRTGTGVKSIFAPPNMRFSLDNNTFPLLTTKRVFLRPIFEELLWFIRGCTDSLVLNRKNVKIWDQNGSREFLDSVKLSHRRVGDLGPVYGFQWRHFGAKYIDADTDYTGLGEDQLKNVIYLLKNEPSSRRIIITAWNVADLNKMALPPCHILCQFYVSNLPTKEEPKKKPKLSCQMYQRSCDMGLGVPFNIASYSLLTILIAYVVNMEPGLFIHTMGDSHVYNDHIIPLQEQVKRFPKKFPKLYIKKHLESRQNLSVEQCIEFLENLSFSDLELEGYVPHPKIEMRMSA